GGCAPRSGPGRTRWLSPSEPLPGAAQRLECRARRRRRAAWRSAGSGSPDRFPAAAGWRSRSARSPGYPRAATRWDAPASRGSGSGRERGRFPSGSWWTSSGRRYVDARLAQAGELVAQRAWTDAEALSRLAPAALMGAQRIEDEIALRLHQRAGERADRFR